MHVLYITQYFQTPSEGGLLRTWEIARYLTKKGHKVTVIAAAPHHMSGKLPESMGKKLFLRQKIEGINVIKTYSYNYYRKNFLNRLLYYLIFPILAFFAGISVQKPDIIITSSPPIFLLPIGFLLCKIKRRDFVVEVRDAWLEFIIARKLVSGIFVRPFTYLQNFMFQKAKKIIAVTPGIKKIISNSVKDKSKVVLIMNGFEEDVHEMVSPSQVDEIKKKYNLDSKFVIIYTGTFGLARDHNIFGQTAKLLKKYDDIVFLFIGEGEKKKELMDFCKINNLRNCIFLPLQPRNKIPLFLKCAHVGINSIRKNDSLESSLSNKIFDYLGNGVPVVFAGHGDTADFLKKCCGGIVTPPEDAHAMRDAVLKLYRDPTLRRQMGIKGKKFVLENCSRSKILKELEKNLLQLLDYSRQ